MVVTEVPTAVVNVMLVKLALVDVRLVVSIFDGLKLLADRLVKEALVEVMDVARKIVDVMAVPEAEVK